MNDIRHHLSALPFLALFSCSAVGLACAQTGEAAKIPAAIQAIFDKPEYKNSTWGLRVVDVMTGETLLDLNPSYPFFIGSVRKVFTIGELINQVGPDHSYDTPVYREGPVNSEGVLQGDLILVASGDLTMGGRTQSDGKIAVTDYDHNEANSLGNAQLTSPDPLAGFAEIARQIAAGGITEIGGDVVIDDRLFNPFLFRGEFNVKPIFVNDDCVDCIMTPAPTAGDPVSFGYRPKSAALTVTSDVKMSAKGTDIDIKSGDIVSSPFIPDCTDGGCIGKMTGQLPIGFVPPLTDKYPLIRVFRIVQPSDYARTVLVEQLRAAGVKVLAPTVEPNPVQQLPAKNSYKPDALVAELHGLPFSDDAKFVLKVSYNIGADTSLVLFGLTQGVDDMDSALAAEQTNLQNGYGIAPGEYHFVDGSGGEKTTAQCPAVTSFLTQMFTRPAFTEYLVGFPVMGVDGSLVGVTKFESDPSLAGARGNVYAKPGTYVALPTIEGQAFAGYIASKSGRSLVYEVVVNNVPFTGVQGILDIFNDQGIISAILWRDY
jgi:D-alanyl-D-alanine carboxypeptidase